MPVVRFVEVVDVGAEASSTLAALLASGRGLSNPYAWFNASDYVNVSIGALRNVFTLRNTTLDTFATGWRNWAVGGLAGAALDALTPNIPSIPDHARQLLLAAVLIVVLREFVTHVLTTRRIRKFGCNGRNLKETKAL